MPLSHSGARSVVPEEPILAEREPAVRLMRTMAALGMIFGCVGVISAPMGLLRLHQGSFAGDLRVSLFSPQIESPTLDALWLYVSSAIDSGLAAMLFLGSIAAMRFRPPARPVLLLWAAGSIGVGLVGCYFYLRWLFSPWRDTFSQVRGEVDVLVNIGGWGINTSLAAAMLVLLLLPNVKDAFARHGQEGPAPAG